MAEKSLLVYIKEFFSFKEKQPDERDLLIKYRAIAASWKITGFALWLSLVLYTPRHKDINWPLWSCMVIMAFSALCALIYYRRKL